MPIVDDGGLMTGWDDRLAAGVYLTGSPDDVTPAASSVLIAIT